MLLLNNGSTSVTTATPAMTRMALKSTPVAMPAAILRVMICSAGIATVNPRMVAIVQASASPEY